MSLEGSEFEKRETGSLLIPSMIQPDDQYFHPCFCSMGLDRDPRELALKDCCNKK